MQVKYPTELEQLEIVDALHFLKIGHALFKDRLDNGGRANGQITQVLDDGWLGTLSHPAIVGKDFPDVQFVRITDEPHEKRVFFRFVAGQGRGVVKTDRIHDDRSVRHWQIIEDACRLEDINRQGGMVDRQTVIEGAETPELFKTAEIVKQTNGFGQA
ncbi:hypothetical protein DESC_290253 [Desulfosarcina cetonica]|nr:hypothetical protein DESC_290253 [Desulfosarcina cetonica]